MSKKRFTLSLTQGRQNIAVLFLPVNYLFWLIFQSFCTYYIEGKNYTFYGANYAENNKFIQKHFSNNRDDFNNLGNQRIGGDFYGDEHQRQRRRQFAAGGFGRKRGGGCGYDCV
jgi:hypothetical protein